MDRAKDQFIHMIMLMTSYGVRTEEVVSFALVFLGTGLGLCRISHKFALQNTVW